MIMIYGHPISSNSRKVHWALEELGIRYVYQAIDLLKGEQKREMFVAKNPNGRVPVLADGELVLWESNAILCYLGDRYGLGGIVPRESDLRALVHQWVFWQASDFGPAIMKPWLMTFFAEVGGAALNEPELSHLGENAKRPLGLLEAHLDGPYVSGETFSIADIALAESFALCEAAQIDTGPYPRLRAWLGRMWERPAFVKTRATK
jgi:glutathione S-transferase